MVKTYILSDPYQAKVIKIFEIVKRIIVTIDSVYKLLVLFQLDLRFSKDMSKSVLDILN